MATFLYLLIIAAAGYAATKYVVLPAIKKTNESVNDDPVDYDSVVDPADEEESCANIIPESTEYECEKENENDVEVAYESEPEQNVGEFPVGVPVPETETETEIETGVCHECECETCTESECEGHPDFYNEGDNRSENECDCETAIETDAENEHGEEEVAHENEAETTVDSEIGDFVVPVVVVENSNEAEVATEEEINDVLNDNADNEDASEENGHYNPTEEHEDYILDECGETGENEDAKESDESEHESESEHEHGYPEEDSEQSESMHFPTEYAALEKVSVKIKFTDTRVSINKALPVDYSVVFNPDDTVDTAVNNLLVIKAGKTGTTIKKRDKDAGNYIVNIAFPKSIYDTENHKKYVFTLVDSF